MVYIDRKPEVNIEDLQYIDPALGIVLYCGYWFARQCNLPFVLTSIWSDIPPDDRKSGVHADQRAIDLSRKGWTDLECNRFKHFLNTQYGRSWGTRALNSDSPTQVCVYGDDAHLDHLHLQVRSGLTLSI